MRLNSHESSVFDATPSAIRELTDARSAAALMRGRATGASLSYRRKEADVATFWTIVVLAFTIGVLATVAFALVWMFTAGPRHLRHLPH